MEYADSLWAHLGGDAEVDVTTEAEVNQWLEKLLDEAEEDNLEVDGVDNEPLAETTWNAQARRILRTQAIMRRTASGEPEWVEAARRIIASKTYESIDGTVLDLFSASAVLAVWDGLTDENKERLGALSLTAAVNTAFKLINKGSRRHTAATCADCGASIERDPEGETNRTWHHNDGDKHDHEAKPSAGDDGGDGESKESRRRTAAAPTTGERMACEKCDQDIEYWENHGWIDRGGNKSCNGGGEHTPYDPEGRFASRRHAETDTADADEEELYADWVHGDDDEELIDPGPLKPQTYQRELHTDIYTLNSRGQR